MSAQGREESKVRRSGSDLPAVAVPPPAWWLPGPHLPTIFGKVFRHVRGVETQRETIATPDGDSLTLVRLQGARDAPRIVLFHGLEGGEHSTYARGLLAEAHARGWWADLVLWRTCDGILVNSVRRSYHSGASDDAALAIEYIATNDDRPMLLHGVSLGGNVLLKWLGEQGSAVPKNVRAAVAVSVPFDLAAASRRIHHGFSSVYERFFLRSLKAKTAAKLARFPDIIDQDALERVRTLWEFDELVTGPLHGFTGAVDYYEKSSSINFLSQIRVDTLLMNARNDPFLPPDTLDRVKSLARENRLLRCEFPPSGGHVGFIAGANPIKPDYWMERQTIEWLSCLMAI